MIEQVFSMRKEILEKCKRATGLVDVLIQDNSKHCIARELARRIRKQIVTLEDKCSVEKYNLFFNGEVGIGKSTAICHLTGLIDGDCLKEGEETDRLPLLKTGSGRTTVCETRIIPTEGQSKIVITKMTEDRFQVYLNEFCESICNSGEGLLEEVPLEIVRVICNMSGFPFKVIGSKTKESEINDYLKKSNVESTDNPKENLYTAISKNINYGSRDLTEIVFTQGRFEDWLREHMTNINDGMMREVPIPEQISIYVNSRDLKLHIPEYISSIVDTKGLDAIEGRKTEEIIGFMDKSDSISVMCEGIKAFGADDKIHVLLRDALARGGEDRFHRIFLLGLGSESDVKKANNADKDYERGVEIKRSEALYVMKGIPMKEEHIDCYDAFSGIVCANDVILKTDEIAWRRARGNFWHRLEKGLQEMYQAYYSEIKDLTDRLEYLGKNELSESIIYKLSKCRGPLESFQMEAEDQFVVLENEITQKMEMRHPGVIRACVNRNGSYEKIDIYMVSYWTGGNEFREKLETKKEKLVERLKDIFDSKDEMDQICLFAMVREIGDRYSIYYSESCDHYKACVHNCMKDDPLWRKLSGYWGKGIDGYRKKVIVEIIEELERQNITAKLAEKDFCKAFIEDVGKIMDIYR